MRRGTFRISKLYRCQAGDGWRSLRRWYQQPLGQSLLEVERLALEPLLADIFGFHLLQVGAPHAVDLTESSRIRHRMLMESLPLRGELPMSPLRGSGEQLPFATDSVDLLLYPHSLEFSADPHQVLREADRVLIPEGHVIILGFNPMGLWGMGRALWGWKGEAPWCGRFISVRRLKDWLSLLGFDTLSCQGIYHRPPISHAPLLERTALLERLGGGRLFGAGAYILLAKKRVSTLTPLRPRWLSARRLVAGGLTEPSARRESNER